MKINNLISPPALPSSISSWYTIIKELGRGAFSTVYKIKSNINQQYYCLKKINLKKTKDKNNEINLLQNLSHINLVKYISSCTDESGIYIIMEYCEYGDLYSLLHSVRKKKVYVNEDIIWDIAYQSLQALNYLHSKHIIHRDIKLLNIFLTKEKIIKIGDFGMSKLLENKEMKMSRVGTPLYLAPELVKKEKYDYKADIWSLGCSLYHLAKTVPPFNDENLIRLGYAIVNNQPDPLPDCYSRQLNNFILALMTKDKKNRPSAGECIKLIPEKIRNKYCKENKQNASRSAIESPRLNSNVSKHLGNNNSCSSSINKNFKEGEGLGVAGKLFNKIRRNMPDRKKFEIFRKTNKNFYSNHSLHSNNSEFNNLQGNSGITGFFMSKTMGGTQEGFFKPNKLNINTNNFPSNPENQNENRPTDDKKEEIFTKKLENRTCVNFYKPKIQRIEKKNKKTIASEISQVTNELSFEENKCVKDILRTKVKETQVIFPKIEKDKNKINFPIINHQIEINDFTPVPKEENKKINYFRNTFTGSIYPHFQKKVLTIHDFIN